MGWKEPMNCCDRFKKRSSSLPDSGQDRVNFCSRQDGAWLGHGDYSVLSQIISGREEKGIS